MPKNYAFLVLILLLVGSTSLFAQQKILFFQTDWGNEFPMDEFLAKVKADGYDGVEVWMPGSQKAKSQLKQGLEKYGLKVIFLHGTNKGLPYNESLKAYQNGLQEILKWNPVKVNSHTGSDFWTLEQNIAFLEVGEKMAAKAGIQLVHETHRARFSYSLPMTLEMLEKFPGLKLTLDISHWMVVHERLIGGDDPFLQKILPAVHHIHSRVGFAEGPQINNPEAPEWAKAVEVHLEIWEKIIRSSKDEVFTITTEFGPPPYLPTVPFTNEPIADQWAANVYIMKAIKARLQ
jgi:hypothetical protein